MDKEILRTKVSLHDEDYLTDLSQWSRAAGLELAKEEGLEMTNKHWAVSAARCSVAGAPLR